MKRTIILAILFVLLLSGSAQAFTIEGGDQAQQDCVTLTILSCPLPARLIEGVLGPVTVRIEDFRDSPIVGYAVPGLVRIDSEVPAGPLFRSIVQHEWAHEIWFSMDSDRYATYRDRCDPLGLSAGASPYDRELSLTENFAECARAALWGAGDFPIRTDLNVVDLEWLRHWIAGTR